MVSSGLAEAGFKYINVDCGWTTGFRDGATGKLQVDKEKFPDLPGLIRELHGLNLRFGMYAGGTSNSSSKYGQAAQCCHRGIEGANDTSWGHWDTDAAFFKDLNIDYLKSDPCVGHPPYNVTKPLTAQKIFSDYNLAWVAAFKKLDYEQHVFLQGSGPTRACGENASSCAAIPSQLNSWRTTADVQPTFDSVLKNIQDNDAYASLAGPHHWNDADVRRRYLPSPNCHESFQSTVLR